MANNSSTSDEDISNMKSTNTKQKGAILTFSQTTLQKFYSLPNNITCTTSINSPKTKINIENYDNLDKDKQQETPSFLETNVNIEVSNKLKEYDKDIIDNDIQFDVTQMSSLSDSITINTKDPISNEVKYTPVLEKQDYKLENDSLNKEEANEYDIQSQYDYDYESEFKQKYYS